MLVVSEKPNTIHVSDLNQYSYVLAIPKHGSCSQSRIYIVCAHVQNPDRTRSYGLLDAASSLAGYSFNSCIQIKEHMKSREEYVRQIMENYEIHAYSEYEKATKKIISILKQNKKLDDDYI